MNLSPQDIVMLITSMVACLTASVLNKVFSQKANLGLFGTFLFTGVASLVSALVLFLTGGLGQVSLFTVLLALAFGVVNASQTVATIVALRYGPLSYTSVIVSLSTIVTALSGFLFFSEGLSWPHIVGTVMILATFVLAVEKGKDEKKAGMKWFLLTMISFFACGGVGLMQKTHQSSAFKEELNGFLIIAFAFSFLFSLIAALVLLPKQKEAVKAVSRKMWIFLAVITVVAGVAVSLNHKFNLYLSGVMPSAVFFPLVNGVQLIAATLVSFFLFRERLSVKQWIGMAIGAAAVIILCNPMGAPAFLFLPKFGA
jgi:drug/metabolite transporter (DMT)-like permease